jgi:protein-S-isoprenylcysteine O-methyltransferase Ste14
MEIRKDAVFKILYGSLFVIILPCLLILWANRMDKYFAFPVPDMPVISYLMLVTGCCLMFGGWLTLVIYGKGLPMNAFPPMELVTIGVYRLIPHPIYTGFCLTVLAGSLLLHSPSGVWIVFPTICLGCIALVYGYERQAMQQRFGDTKIECLLQLPENAGNPASVIDYIRVYLLVLLPWLIIYEAFQFVIPVDNSLILAFKFEKSIPVIEWTEAIYISIYFVVILFPVFIKKKNELREFSQFVLISILACIYVYTLFPVCIQPKEFEVKTLWGFLLNFERTYDKPICAFPSFHVIWAFICAKYYSKGKFSTVFWYFWAVILSISCITTGAHTILDVIMGVFFFYIIKERIKIWDIIRGAAEEIANSWKEIYIGRLRLINHGLWAALGVFLGIVIVYTLTGLQNSPSILISAFMGIIGAALWAQLVEGSNVLLRPYGYYGGVIGIFAGTIISGLFFHRTEQTLAAFAVAGPVIQSFGRLRCLVQGCCHGKPADELTGIRYNDPHSRVTRLSEYSGKYIHPTPVYSILWNIIIFFILVRLFFTDFDVNVISGTYLILTGLGRFVEESLRGEPQTKIIGGLRLYQWIAIATVTIGAVFISFPGGRYFDNTGISPQIFIYSFIVGFVVYFALGADIPSSNKRFSRLT